MIYTQLIIRVTAVVIRSHSLNEPKDLTWSSTRGSSHADLQLRLRYLRGTDVHPHWFRAGYQLHVVPQYKFRQDELDLRCSKKAAGTAFTTISNISTVMTTSDRASSINSPCMPPVSKVQIVTPGTHELRLLLPFSALRQPTGAEPVKARLLFRQNPMQDRGISKDHAALRNQRAVPEVEVSPGVPAGGYSADGAGASTLAEKAVDFREAV